MKIKASDLEKQWGEDLEQRGVFEPKETLDWEKEYCKKFGLCRDGEKCQCKDELKFISNLLTSQKEQLIKEIEQNIKKEGVNMQWKNGWNQAIDAIVTLLKT